MADEEASAETRAQASLFEAIVRHAATPLSADDILTLAVAYDKLVGDDTDSTEERDPYSVGGTQFLGVDTSEYEEEYRGAKMGFTSKLRS